MILTGFKDGGRMPKQDTYFVYMHTNKINGKRYIGITGQKTTARRWHNGKGYSQQRRFYNSIISHGWDAFDHEILYEGLTREEAEAMIRAESGE